MSSEEWKKFSGMSSFVKFLFSKCPPVGTARFMRPILNVLRSCLVWQKAYTYHTFRFNISTCGSITLRLCSPSREI